MYSVIITAWKEPEQIKRALDSILNPKNNEHASISGRAKNKFEILVVCPDYETSDAAKEKFEEYNFKNYKWIKDKQEGKPKALNMAFREAKGEILIMTDGDVFMGKDAIPKLLEHFKDEKVGGITGRPVARGKKSDFMQFAAHFYADVADHKRKVTMMKDVKGKSLRVVSKEPGFFVLSGYCMAIRNIIKKIPEDCLSDDAYISYFLHNEGYKLEYEPDAEVYVKYADNLKDWYDQKIRSVGGYEQLWDYGIVKPETKVRNFRKELEYAVWYPFTYVKRPKEILWAIMLYPTRFWLWIRIFWQHKIKKKSFKETWVRIESTK